MSTGRSMSPTVMEFVALLGNGKKNAISRKDLAKAAGVSDRKVRQHIEEARAAGVIICNEQDGGGYFIAATMEEAQAQYNQERARALSVLRRLTPLRRMLRQAEKNTINQ